MDQLGQGVLVTDPEGQVAYPGPVPPTTRPPCSPLPPANASDDQDDDETRRSNQSGKGRQNSEPILSVARPALLPQHKSHVDQPTADDLRRQRRPSPSKQRSLFRPSTRTGKASYLNKAIWEGHDQNRNSTSSSSSLVSSAVSSAAGPGSETNFVGRADDTARPRSQRRRPRFGSSDDRYSRFDIGNQDYTTSGTVKKDGRLAITVNETANKGYLAQALGAILQKAAAPEADGDAAASGSRPQTGSRLSSASTEMRDLPRLRLNIVIMVIGSRGDAQPFLKIGKVLKEQYGHRVRIATHPAFRDFVEKDSGLEFFSVGGDPSELMAFMVKNPGLIPTIESVKAGDIGKRRAAMAEMFDGFWRACINATDDEKDSRNLKMMGEKDPFVADAIIANPPSFAHIHCAEALGIPLHLMFTFPYTPTQAFPHPLASIKKSNVDPGYTNFISYPLVEMMVWQGLGDLVNQFRVKTLALDPVSTLWAPGSTYRLHVPFTYLWSPGLVPKPQDWPSEIDISGFVFLDLASTFEPPKELEDFLAAGEPPIYIGFGSIVVDDADQFTEMIFKAVELAGVRALVSRGWGGFGADKIPENIFMLGNTPHDWLFPKIRACVIHGGAGTTAIALKCGKPTMVVPFFGDQNFWGQMMGKAGVGPDPVPYKRLTSEKLAEGIKFLLTDEAAEAADKIAKDIVREGDGAENAVKAFHRQLALRGPITLRCSILKEQVAVWQVKGTSVRLSSLAADFLVDHGLISWKKLRLLRHTEWNDYTGPGEPVTGVAGSIAKTIGQTCTGIVSVPYHLVKRGKLHRQKQVKRKRAKRTQHTIRAETETPDAPVDGRLAVDALSVQTIDERADQHIQEARSGVKQTTKAITKAPVDLALALAQGFHNAPRLYGDDTVRRPPRVTGFKSGLRAARDEFMYGVYDGFTGIVRLPYRGARERGVVGFVQGTGMGLTGFILKNLSAIFGPFGYTLKGIVKQAERSKTPQRFIRRARITQGQREANALSEEDRKVVLKKVCDGYRVLKDLCDKITDLEKKRGLAGQIERVLLDKGFLFEDVEVARNALDALNRGESLDSVLNQEREGDDKARDVIRRLSSRRSLSLSRKEKEPRDSSTGQDDRDITEKAANSSGHDQGN